MKQIEALKDSFLFSDVDFGVVSKVISASSAKPCRLQRGERVSFPSEGGIGFVISGRLDVIREKEDGGAVVLNRISPGGVFGLLSVFSNEPYPTDLVASLNSTVLFIPQKALLELMENNRKSQKI